MTKSWASSLKLPKSTFPPRPAANLRKQYIEQCTTEFYRWQASNRPEDETFILHDGPPYANGDLHAGHALNKILKDIIIRFKVQQGKRVSYVPGWDCHGLPIELKAVGAAEGKNIPPVSVRVAAQKLAAKTVSKQMNSFKSYAVMGDWENSWRTMDPDYEIRQLRLFQKMVGRGLVYRKFKPVYWSPSSGTALAEAELEYNENHISKAAYVRFPVLLGDQTIPGMEEFRGKLYALIWTTTPWTLPANRAIAVHDDLLYHVVRAGDDAYLVAEGCFDRLSKLLWGEDATPEIIASVKGSDLTKLKYTSILDAKKSVVRPMIHAPFVTADSGSGLVHIAPGHGFDDYSVTRDLELDASAPVDNNGLFTEEAYPDEPSKLQGYSVLQGGSQAVLELIGENALKVHEFKHKYPYDWRTKQPIIIRATAQWFADVGSIKKEALEALEHIRFVPESGRNRLEAFIKGRNEWCISRQRAWGVPIPALYKPNGEAVMTEETISHIISVIEDRGINAWWTDSPGEQAWVPESLREENGQTIKYTRGKDTMDVWFDSGSSWTMMGDRQADMYLEGSDQHRGWFQSSLLTRVAAMVAQNSTDSTTNTLGLSPFKTLITHGFTLDKDGKKMSKSLGNIISADEVMDGSLLPLIKRKGSGQVKDALGPDALRLWVANSEYSRDIVLGEPVLKSIHQSLIKYRIMIKMLTGSMHKSARVSPLTTLDHIAIFQLRDVMAEVHKHYENYDFNKALNALNRWVANDLSSFYLEALKDRLYCGDGGGVLEPLFTGFLRMLASVTPVLVEEAWDHRPTWLKEDDSVHHPLHQLYNSPVIDPSRLTLNEADIRAAMPALMSAHAAIKGASEQARVDKVMGSSLQCSVLLQVPEGTRQFELFAKYKDELADMFVVSSLELNGEVPAEAEWKYDRDMDIDGEAFKVWVLPPKQSKCPRCYRYVAPREDELCGRCDKAVESLA
ncbi:isoleucine--tRNA ligase [Naviculisporaceae sp. PSN 640]